LLPKDLELPKRDLERSLRMTSRDHPSSVVRSILSLYLLGYNTIRVFTDEERISSQQKEMIREFIRKKLVGIEVISDSMSEMTFQVLISYPQLTVDDALKRMYVMVSTIHRDLLDSLSRSDLEPLSVIIQADDEVDRFNFYITRQLNVAVENYELILEIGLVSPADCLGYRLITKSIECIADHAVNMARNVGTVKHNSGGEAYNGLAELSVFAIDAFDDAMKSLFQRDYRLADNVIERKTKMEAMAAQETSRILQAGFDVETISSLRLIIDSTKRTLEYSSDIAEAVMNMTIQAALHENTQNRRLDSITS
jgi:phosphate uptake regulator